MRKDGRFIEAYNDRFSNAFKRRSCSLCVCLTWRQEFIVKITSHPTTHEHFVDIASEGKQGFIGIDRSRDCRDKSTFHLLS